MKLTFFGAAKGVTGSKTMLSTQYNNYLIDCGMYQGPKFLRDFNWDFEFNVSSISCIFLTHAHIDHSGLLPRIYKKGYRKPIYSSLATFELCEILLMDAAKLQEEDAAYANMTKYSNHNPAEPLYTIEEAAAVLKLFRPTPLNEWVKINDEINLRLIHSGHILGSTFVQIQSHNPSHLFTFSGDLGHHNSSILKGPENITETDFLILESTYGNKLRSRVSPEEELPLFINSIIKKNGVTIIPAFTVGRAQELIYIISKLMDEGKIPKVKLFLDSPMAVSATELFLNHPQEHKADINKSYLKNGCIPIKSATESQNLIQTPGPFIVITASGMLTGGRVMHHLKQRLPHPNNGVIFVGFQAKETKGRLLLDGINSLRIHHEEIPVNAQIYHIDSLSAHADYLEILEWLRPIKRPIQCIFLNHGEPQAQTALKGFIETEFSENQIKVTIPDRLEIIDLRQWSLE